MIFVRQSWRLRLNFKVVEGIKSNGMRSVLTIFLLLAAGYAKSDLDYPTNGMVYGEREHRSITYSCREESIDLLSCEFSLVALRKSSSTEELEAFKDKLQQEISGGRFKQDCEMYSQMQDVFSGDAELPMGANLDMIEAIKDEGVSMLRTVAAVDSWCEIPSKVNELAMIETMLDGERKKCVLSGQRFEQKFSRVAVSNPTVWAVVDTPSGPCGIQNISSFIAREQSGLTFWDYNSRKFVHNPDGFNMGVPCFKVDQNAYPHSWRPKSTNLVCDSFEFAP